MPQPCLLKLTLPTATAGTAVQFNTVYLTPRATAPSFSIVPASDKRYSLDAIALGCFEFRIMLDEPRFEFFKLRRPYVVVLGLEDQTNELDQRLVSIGPHGVPLV